MPPSIDPFSNLVQSTTSLFGRVLACLLSGSIANALGFLSTNFQYWDDFSYYLFHPSEWGMLLSSFSNINLLAIGFWPLIFVYYLFEIPIYAFFAGILSLISAIKIVTSEEGFLFWMGLNALVLLPGMVIAQPNLCTATFIAPFMIAAGALLWYGLQTEHPDWLDWMQEKFSGSEH